MTIAISSEDPRSIKAIEIAAGATSWLKCRRNADGQKCHGIPSACQPARFYLVDAQRCDCPDFQRHGLSGARIGTAGDHRACKHVLAVRLHCELVKAQQTQPKRRHLTAVPTATAERYDSIFGRL